MGIEGNIPSCTGKSNNAPRQEKPPKEPKDQKRLARIGSRYFSKDTKTERRLNFGVRLGKTPTGVEFKTQNELVTEKQRVFNPVNKRLPTFSGEEVKPENVPLPPVTEEGEEEQPDLR